MIKSTPRVSLTMKLYDSIFRLEMIYMACTMLNNSMEKEVVLLAGKQTLKAG